jgi:hypothetical protein
MKAQSDISVGNHTIADVLEINPKSHYFITNALHFQKKAVSL